MKKYSTPNAELVLLAAVDVLTASDLTQISWEDFSDTDKDVFI